MMIAFAFLRSNEGREGLTLVERMARIRITHFTPSGIMTYSVKVS